MFDYLIVGAGFAGSVMAERLASQLDKKVLLVDRRPHIGGNAYDHYDDAGVLVHKYGPHIFHTNSERIFAYLSQFTEWRPYEHRVLACVHDQLVPIPINRTTLNRLFRLDLNSDEEAARYLASRAEPVDEILTSEDVVVAAVGRELYELFFQGYTRKQWGLDPSQLDKAVTALQQNPTMRLQIEGHTCNIGTNEYNQALGERRAGSVRDYLISRGIAADRLSTVSYGEDRPKHDNMSEVTRRLNRRAALIVRLQFP